MDLGCNAGFWSLCAIENGCDFLLGIDGRQINIDQANFVFQVKDIAKSKYSFICDNVYDCDFQEFGTFDIVLYLGLMTHVSKPITLIEKIAQINSDILIIDTELSMIPGSYMEINHENVAEPNSLEYELVMSPTKQAVISIAKQFGYSAGVLKPRFQNPIGIRDYQFGFRRTFLCAKQTSLNDLPFEVETSGLRTQLTDIFIWLAQKAVRFIRKTLHR